MAGRDAQTSHRVGEAEPLEAPPRPDLHRVCTECGRQLKTTRANAKTCSDRCRKARHLRLKRERQQARGIDSSRDGVGTEAMSKIAPSRRGGRRGDLLSEVMREELRPVVREQITEETLRAIQELVKATPIMVKAIIGDMQHPDPVIRQRAYQVAARYTLGHTAIVTPPEQTNAQMTVIFPGMPSTGQQPAAVDVESEDVPDEAVRTCNSCHETKPAAEFVAESDLCRGCFDGRQAKLKRLLEGD